MNTVAKIQGKNNSKPPLCSAAEAEPSPFCPAPKITPIETGRNPAPFFLSSALAPRNPQRLNHHHHQKKRQQKRASDPPYGRMVWARRRAISSRRIENSVGGRAAAGIQRRSSSQAHAAQREEEATWQRDRGGGSGLVGVESMGWSLEASGRVD